MKGNPSWAKRALRAWRQNGNLNIIISRRIIVDVCCPRIIRLFRSSKQQQVNYCEYLLIHFVQEIGFSRLIWSVHHHLRDFCVTFRGAGWLLHYFNGQMGVDREISQADARWLFLFATHGYVAETIRKNDTLIRWSLIKVHSLLDINRCWQNSYPALVRSCARFVCELGVMRLRVSFPTWMQPTPTTRLGFIKHRLKGIS